MPQHELVDVDVSGVHLVGSPANRRPFALVKNLTGQKPQEPTMPDAAAPFKKSDLLQKLEGMGDTISWPVIADMFGGQSAIAKALGLPDKPAPAPTPTPEPLDKSKLSPEVVARLEALEKTATDSATALQALVKANELAERAELRKRAEALTKTGFEVDGEKATRTEIELLEKARDQVIARLEKAGVLRQLGDPTATQGEAAGLRDMVTKSVTRRLGRDPVSKEEEARTRLAIYREHPGLLTQVVKEERRRRAA